MLEHSLIHRFQPEQQTFSFPQVFLDLHRNCWVVFHEAEEIYVFDPWGKLSLHGCAEHPHECLHTGIHHTKTQPHCTTSSLFLPFLPFFPSVQHIHKTLLQGCGSPLLTPQQTLFMSEIDALCMQGSWHFTERSWSQARQTLGAVC